MSLKINTKHITVIGFTGDNITRKTIAKINNKKESSKGKFRHTKNGSASAKP